MRQRITRTGLIADAPRRFYTNTGLEGVARDLARKGQELLGHMGNTEPGVSGDA